MNIAARTILLAALVLTLGLTFGLALSGVAMAQDMKVTHAWARTTPPGVDRTALYATIENRGDREDRLVGVSSPDAGRAELHEVVQREGMMVMQPVAGGLLIPAGSKVMLKPGSYHVMVMKLRRPIAEGDRIAFTFTFEHAGVVPFEAVGAQEMPTISHDH